MARKEKKETKLLNLSMDAQCILMNTESKQQLRAVIDTQDDLRRNEFRKNIKDKLLDIFESLEYEDCNQAKKKLIKLEKFLKDEFEKEDYYEQLDDENRINTKDYLKESTEQIKEINFQVECELVKK